MNDRGRVQSSGGRAGEVKGNATGIGLLPASRNRVPHKVNANPRGMAATGERELARVYVQGGPMV